MALHPDILSTDRLVRSIKRRGAVPDNQLTFPDSEIIELINEEISTAYLPYIMRVHEEYLVVSKDIDLVSGVLEYEIPSRAIGNKLRDVAIVDGAGGIYELSRISLEHLSEFQGAYGNFRQNVFYLQNNSVVLPNNFYGDEAKLRTWYFIKPNSIVAENRAGNISAIDTVTGEVTITGSAPDHFTSSLQYDLISHNNPNKILAFDLDISAIDSSATDHIITFTAADLPTNLQVGDYVMSQYETIVPQIPLELQPLLAQKVAITIMEAQGDAQGSALAKDKLDKMEKDILTLVDNRVEGAPEKINATNSPLRYGTGRGSRKGY